jgi:predicted RNA-binding Zn-ribbon protein involved in translation (DUF1610 family)
MSAAGEKVRKCVICGSACRVEANHVGGRNHIAWFTCPLCGEHHDRFHALLRQAVVDLQYTSDPLERGIRVLKAILIFAWMVVEGLHQAMRQSRKGQHERDA